MRWRDRTVQEAEERLDQQEGERADRDWLAEYQQRARRHNLAAGGVFVLALLAFFAVLASGCATVTRTPTGREVRLEEVKGGVVAAVMTNTVGSEVDSVTLPTNPPTTLLLRDSDDPGLLCHERKHREQIIELGWLKFVQKYAGQVIQHGYWMAPMEVEARAAQDACAGGGP